MTSADILPGALDLLQELRQAGIRIGIASASENSRTVLDHLSLWDNVDAVSDSRSVQRQKPAPDLFLHCARQLGVVPHKTLVVEDAAAGVEAALAGGFRAIGLGPVERVGAAHLVLPSLEGVTLPDILALLSGTAEGTQGPVKSSSWLIREVAFDPERLHHLETVFTVGNGYLGTRGAFEEGFPEAWPITLINGVCDDAPIGRTELVNVPDWLDLRLVLAGEPFSLDQGTILEWERTLDMRTGTLARWVRWRSPAGRTVLLTFERCPSLADPHRLGLRCQVRALDFAGEILVQAGLNGRVDNEGRSHWVHLAQGQTDGKIYLHSRTMHTGIECAAAAALQVEAPGQVTQGDCDDAAWPTLTARFTLSPDEEATVEKIVTIWTSRDDPDALTMALHALEEAADEGYSGLRRRSDACWEKIWSASNIVIEGDDRADRAVRFNLFQLLIAAPWHDSRISIPARTLSGLGYRGHIFWDTDIFIVPFFTWTQPQVARNLLLYRYHTLDGARQKARAWGYPGAAYAWESAATGEETTPAWGLGPDGQPVRIWTGDIELHITADVAYAIWTYWHVTGDDAFMRNYGVEILLEAARFWAGRLEDREEVDRYELNRVIGPDEYHEHVNNNAFTNAMVRWHLGTAAAVMAWLRQAAPQQAAALADRLKLSDEEISLWPQMAERIHIPYDAERGLLEQFSGFFGLQEASWEDFRGRKVALDALLGRERIQQTQAIKQPDVLMLLYLLPGQYSIEEKRAHWAYYEPRTDHAYGSSLGPAIHAALGAQLGFGASAYEHFMRAALMDLEDLRGNTKDGVHAASAGGVWQAVVFGFAGLGFSETDLLCRPRLPEHWKRLSFPVCFRGKTYRVDLPGGVFPHETRQEDN